MPPRTFSINCQKAFSGLGFMLGLLQSKYMGGITFFCLFILLSCNSGEKDKAIQNYTSWQRKSYFDKKQEIEKAILGKVVKSEILSKQEVELLKNWKFYNSLLVKDLNYYDKILSFNPPIVKRYSVDWVGNPQKEQEINITKKEIEKLIKYLIKHKDKHGTLPLIGSSRYDENKP